MTKLVLTTALLSCGCGRYADFELPAPGGAEKTVKWKWEVNSKPVLERGARGEWDAVDVLNPSVVKSGERYLNLYSGYDGRTWHTGLAVSGDGLKWEKKGRVLSPDAASWEGGYIAANGTTLEYGGELYHWYQAGDPPKIGLAKSRDGGAHWKKQPAPVVELGPRLSWDECGVADPYVIRSSEFFYLFFLGQDRARRQRLGVARSRDGVTWEKLRSNPVLELGVPGTFDENGLGEPAVWTALGRHWMLYVGRDKLENRKIGLAWSKNGVKWQRWQNGAVFAGDQPWNLKVVCDPTLELLPGSVRMWFGGGDVARPAENIHGAIGVANLTWEME